MGIISAREPAVYPASAPLHQDGIWSTCCPFQPIIQTVPDPHTAQCHDSTNTERGYKRGDRVGSGVGEYTA